MSSAPLAGLRVLDLGHYLAGPWCARLFGMLGATVVKVERPTGDPQRRMSPLVSRPDGSRANATFLYANAGKHGVTLDLKTATGKYLFNRLVKESDVIVENFSPGVLQHLGFDYHALKRVNPSIIVTSISNFGQTGPCRDYRASELVLYAAGGLMSISGVQGEEPLKHGLFTQAQFAAGTVAGFATLSALAARRRSGQGGWVDVSVAETLASELVSSHAYYAYTGAVQSRQRRPEVNIDGRVGLVQTRDGWVHPSLGVADGAVVWETLANMLEAPALIQERFYTHANRVQHTDDLVDSMREAVAGKEKHKVFQEANSWRLPWGVSQTMGDLLKCPQLCDRKFFASSSEGPLAQLPFHSSSPWTAPNIPAPALGEHNVEVYGHHLGLMKLEILALRAEGVI